MLALHPNEIVIHGTTSNGKTFRPSDWSERLCGILSSFDKGNRLAYHEWVRPMLADKVRCVAVDKKLEELNPPMFRFLMDFAADNDLRVFDYEGLQAEMARAEQRAAQPAQPAPAPAAETAPTPVQTAPTTTPAVSTTTLREIAPNEASLAFAALGSLTSTPTDQHRFIEQMNAMQREGCRFIGIFEENKNNAVAVYGFRIHTHLVHGRCLNIDHFAVVAQGREQGYTAQLLAEIARIAKAEGVAQIRLDVEVGSSHHETHKLLFQHGFGITAHHFSCPTEKFS